MLIVIEGNVIIDASVNNAIANTIAVTAPTLKATAIGAFARVI